MVVAQLDRAGAAERIARGERPGLIELKARLLPAALDEHRDFCRPRGMRGIGKPQIVARSLVADLDTPVSAWMKLGASDPYSFLFESVQGGELRGRYSIIGLKPDIIWRCRGGKAELNLRAQEAPDTFTAEAKYPLASLRELIAKTRMELPPALPPMACR